MFLEIPYLAGLREDNLQQAADLLRHLPQQAIACNNWHFPYAPETHFSLAHNGNGLFLHFKAQGEIRKASLTEDNSLTCNDTCVELFLAPDREGYYNFEFNCIGTLLLAYGACRHDRRLAGPEILRTIRRLPSLGFCSFEEKQVTTPWELTLLLPASALFCHQLKKWDGMQACMNLYTCGDGLSRRHYLSWQPVPTAKPDFHTPAYFGNVTFQTPASL